MLDLLDSDALELEAEKPRTEDSSVKNSTEIDFSGIDLDLDLENTADVQSTDIEEETLSTNADTKNEQWHEVETKIDLAKAYLDMEDKEGAREMLEEAILEGDSKQQEAAKALLKDL
jgi:pilus assembly protein FimV